MSSFSLRYFLLMCPQKKKDYEPNLKKMFHAFRLSTLTVMLAIKREEKCHL